MIELDLKKKDNWKMSGVNYDSSVKMNKRGYFYGFLEKPGDYEVRILSKNISGNGLFYVKILNDEGKPIFDKKVKFTSKSWNETIFRINLKNFGKKAKLLITRDLDGIGRLEIGRLTVSLIEEKAVTPKARPKLLSSNKLIRCEASLRVAVIVPYGIYGSGEVYLKNLFYNKPNNIETDFLFLKQNKLLDYFASYKCHILPNLNKLKHQLIKESYDKVVYYNSKAVYSFLLNLKKNNLLEADLIEIYHSDFRWSDSLSSLRSREAISKIIRVSDNLCNDIEGDFGLKTVPVSIDVSLYEKKETPLSQLPKFNTHDKIFGLVARLSPEKNINYAIDLFKRLKKYKLIIIGDGPLRSAISERLEKEGINNVELLGYKENVNEYYNIMDAFILTSKSEGTPISIIEAMAYNLPIFTTDVGEIKSSFNELDEINYLSSNLEDDLVLLKDFCFKNKPTYRDYIVKNNNSIVNSAIFFDEIIENSLVYSEVDNAIPVLDGQYF